MVAMVLRGDRIVAQGAAGVRKLGAPDAVTIDDQFELGSCAKAMMATLVARVIETGKLHWDTTLAELFADVLPRIDPAWRSVTVRQALAHRAGMADHRLVFARTALWSSDDTQTQRRNYAAKILSAPPDYPPGTKVVYNSTDYLVLAAALEKVTGRTWEDLMRRELFEPLGLTTAGFGPPGSPGRIDQPWGHGGRWLFHLPLPGGGRTPFDPGDRDADYPMAGAPAGMVHMAIGDWARFVVLHLRGDAANPQRNVALLKPATIEQLHEWGAGDSYSGGWFTTRRAWAKGFDAEDTGRVLFHQGDNGRWNSVVYLAPEIDFAVLIACNRASMWEPVDLVAGTLVGTFARPTAAGAGPK